MRLVKSWPTMLSWVSCGARTEDWVALSHAASEKEASGGRGIYLFPENDLLYPFSFDSCSGNHMGLQR